MTIYSSRVGVSGLCWDVRGQSNHAFPCLEGFPENACRRYDGPSFPYFRLMFGCNNSIGFTKYASVNSSSAFNLNPPEPSPRHYNFVCKKDGKFLGGENYSLIWAICIYLGTCRWTGFWFFGFVFWQSWRLLGREDGGLQCVVEI